MNNKVTAKRQPGPIAMLRGLMPDRPLGMAESFRIAELQANKLIELLGLERPPVANEAIAGLPRIKAERVSPLHSSGFATWSGGWWHIVLNGSEPWTRQRFSLAHELKHVIDHPFIERAYPKVVGHTAGDRAEQICDYFAACLLMPKAWVKRLYCNKGVQELAPLARRFAVSQMAMRVRLLQLGLIEPLPRCAPYRRASIETDCNLTYVGRVAA